MKPSVLLAASAALAVAAATLPACRCGDSAPTADLTVATMAEYDGLARTIAGRWQASHPGKSVELISLGGGDFYQAMLPRIYSGAGVPDLLVVDATFLARTGAPAFEDLGRPPYDARTLAAGLVPQAVAAGRSETGAQVGLPVAAAPALLYYRRDLLEKAGVPEVELSSSWERLVAAGARVKAATGAYLTPQAIDLVQASLAAQVRPGESIYFGPGGAFRLQGPPFERAFALARAVRAADLAAGVRPGSAEWGQALGHGVLLTHLGGPTELRRLAFAVPEEAGLWRAAPLPEPLPADGAYLAIPARGGRHALAWDVVRAALTAEAQHAAFADATAYPALTAALADPMLDEPVKMLGDQRLGALWRDALARAPGFVPNRKDPIPAASLQAELDRVLERGKDVPTALADAAAEARKRLERTR